ncbi:GNAT family N-acetyltransferase [Paenibacillus sp. NPDC058177]|uniref:GNAT family N-acetyltransferase n=1 Tax=Paenibacillus sp. NPDC058177 TaxID=3346369 RepID=UPI0036D79E21
MSDFEFPSLQTARLTLRLLTIEDSHEVYKHFADEDVTRFMDISPCKSVEEAEEIIQFGIDHPGCRWGIFETITGTLIGTCGYHCWVTQSNGEAKAEIGYDLSKAYWGQGFMTEVMSPVISFGFEQMGLSMIEATVEPQNERSIQLLNRLGFTRHQELVDQLVYFHLYSPLRETSPASI